MKTSLLLPVLRRLAALRAAVLFPVVLAAGSGLSADTFVFRDGLNGYAGTADTYLNNSPTSTADTNYGTGAALHTRYSSADTAGFDPARESRNILIRFDDLGLTGFEVTSAQLTLSVASINSNSGGSASIQFFAYELLIEWSESSATWNSAATGAAWQSAGARGAEDRVATPFFTSSTYSINSATPTLAVGDTVTITLSASLVQSWLDDPSGNHGILISVGVSNKDRFPAISFDSSEAAEALLRPTLTLTGTAIPEPGAYALFAGMGAWMMLSARRRRVDGRGPAC